MTNATPSALPAIAADTTLASLATTYAGASRVFLRHGLDFCCNGQISVGEACQRKGLDRERILAELRAELSPAAAEVRWDHKPVGEIVDHILEHYHQGHRRELPRLLQMAEKVERVHAAKSDCPRGLAAHLHHVAHSLERHMLAEEQVLFPAARAGHGTEGRIAVRDAEEEHQEHGRNLAKIRRLAHDLVPPPAACGTWRALYLGLAELEQEVMQHIHLENHVLFPRVLAR
jgi:regulator of cell morphogenesis and NO signaling